MTLWGLPRRREYLGRRSPRGPHLPVRVQLSRAEANALWTALPSRTERQEHYLIWEMDSEAGEHDG